MLPTLVTPARQHADLDIKLLEGLVQSLYTKGIANNTKSAYSTTQCRYLPFCSNFGIAPPPLSEHTLVSSLPTLLTRDYRHTNFPLLIRPLLPSNLFWPASTSIQFLAIVYTMWLMASRGHSLHRTMWDFRSHFLSWGNWNKFGLVWVRTCKLWELPAFGSSLHSLLWLSQAGRGFPSHGQLYFAPPSYCLTLGLTVDYLDPTYFCILIQRAKNNPFGTGPLPFWAKPTRMSAQHKYLRATSWVAPWPRGPVSETRQLSMLEGPISLCCMPPPVKGRSQFLAIRWTQFQNWSCHNCCCCRHSSLHY